MFSKQLVMFFIQWRIPKSSHSPSSVPHRRVMIRLAKYHGRWCIQIQPIDTVFKTETIHSWSPNHPRRGLSERPWRFSGLLWFPFMSCHFLLFCREDKNDHSSVNYPSQMHLDEEAFYHYFGTGYHGYGTCIMISGQRRVCWGFYHDFGTFQKTRKKIYQNFGTPCKQLGTELQHFGTDCT